MKKISTLFKKDPSNLALIIDEVDPANAWALDPALSKATRKFDGTAAAIINSEIYKRYDVKKGRSIPEGAISCQEADLITGHHPHWLKCDRSKKEDRYFFEAFDVLTDKIDGTYELCGEKVQGNPEKIIGHELIPHGLIELTDVPRTFDNLRFYLDEIPYEGIVFHHRTEPLMCKLRKSDFGLKR